MWKWLNPWRELRQARERIAVLEYRCEEYEERAYEAERRAFGYASDHYHQRLRMEEQRNAEAMKRLMDIENLTPRALFAIPRDVRSAMTASPPNTKE